MPKFLNTKHIAAAIDELIRKAQKEIILISPFLRIPNDILFHLKEASKKGVNITLVYGKQELKDEEWEKLDKISNIRILFSKTLHAKCYYNEEHALITSMNLYEYSEEKNIEMGIYINKQIDNDLFYDLTQETKRIISTAEQRIGFCIRCKKEIPYSPQKPLCYSCFDTWREYNNEFYPENYCHKCGYASNEENGFSICLQSPLCPNCDD